MKRDTIFYRIFQQSPILLFDLMPLLPENSLRYTFESVEVKEASFRIDGVLTPPDPNSDVFFTEIQMQLDPLLYERMFAEIGNYVYRRTELFANWRSVAIYPSRTIEQSTTKVPPELFASGRIVPVYLDELGEIEQLPIGLGLMVLTTLDGDHAISEAKGMLRRSSQSINVNGIIEIVSTIMVYKFTELSREEVDAMLGFKTDELKQTRVYRDARQEGRNEGRDEGRREIIFMLLNHKFGELSPKNQAQVQALDPDRLQALSKALFGFSDVRDLEKWF
ncbi:MAG: Rpn family recombination-promoting nuclease/putative transposase [Alkalinema sp. CAN_BIN05]|nr:Rpn family recombination-promoting nuclease/putative transposase [Alkalinema sp. CAN_BIN05]